MSLSDSESEECYQGLFIPLIVFLAYKMVTSFLPEIS